MDGATLAPMTRRSFTVTPSAAHNWAICGGFFAASTRVVRPHYTSYALSLGTAVHELIAAYDRESQRGEDVVASLLARHWRPGRFDAADDQRARDEARSMLSLYDQHRTDEEEELIASECFVRLAPRSIDDNLSIILSGRIDRLSRRRDGSSELMDFKTSSILPSEEELRHDPATTAYHLLADHRFGPGSFAVTQWSLRSNARVTVSLTAADLAAGKGLLRMMVREMASGDFGITPGLACGYCPAHDTCPAQSYNSQLADTLL